MPNNSVFSPLPAGEVKAGSGADISLGPDAPAVLQDLVLLEKLAQFERDQLPERVVHAKGAGAFGRFEVTHDLSRYTCADFLQKPGQRTEVFARFSPRSMTLQSILITNTYRILIKETPLILKNICPQN